MTDVVPRTSLALMFGAASLLVTALAAAQTPPTAPAGTPAPPTAPPPAVAPVAPGEAAAPGPGEPAPPPEAPPAEPALAPPPPPPLPPPPPPPPGVTERETYARAEYEGPPVLLGGRKKPKIGGYGGVGVSYTRMLDRDGVVTGLEGALLIDHRLAVGLALWGFSRTPQGPDAPDGTPREFGTGYGGLLLRYHVFAKEVPVYFSVGTLIGAGVLSLHDEDDDDWDDDWDDDDDDWDNSVNDTFFVVQPDVTVHLNATRWLRFGVTGGYRFAAGVNRFGIDESDINGVVVGGNIQIGWF